MKAELNDILPYPSENLKIFEVTVKYCKRDLSCK